MENHVRHKRLLKLLTEYGSASVSQLAEWLDVSPSTIRRDIRLLDTAGQVKRVHGGGKRIDPRDGAGLRSGNFSCDSQRHPERKRAIARFAASLCHDGETILIGGGTTTCRMTEFLKDRHMRILTNSFAVARILLQTSENEVILSGGKIYTEQSLILSPFDSEAIQYCYADKLFMGAYGVSTLGLMEADPLLIHAGRRLINQARKVIVLADSSKFTNKGGMFLCGLEKIASVVTDDGIADATVQMLERAGIAVKVVAADRIHTAGDVRSPDAGASLRSAPGIVMHH